MKYVRHSGTSLDAAIANEPSEATQLARVRAALEEHPLGLTDHEMQEMLHMNPSTQRPRRVNLVDEFLVVASGRYRLTPSDRWANVWILKEHEKRMTTHSAILGGSNADRLLACPASYQESLKAPVDDVTSPYAEQGTLCHGLTAYCVVNKISARRLRDGFDWGFWEEPVGAEENELVAAALDALEELKQRYGGKFRVVEVERYLPLPGLTGAGGTCDLILANADTIMLIDWKFGAGVMVPVLKDEADGTQTLNVQLAFYTCCGRGAFKRKFANRRIVVAIIQPRAEQPLSETETDNAELDLFQTAFQDAYAAALGRNPHIERGDHCRFARCKVVCPLWTAPVFDLTAIDPTAIQLQASQSPEAGRGYGGFLATALDLAGFAEEWAAEVRRQAHVYLEGGGQVPDWKLVPKRGTRKWLDEGTVHADLLALGANDADIWAPVELRSVAQAEKTLKKRGIEIPDELWHSVSTGTTIARADDGRPASNEAEVVEDLQRALSAL